MALVKYEVNIMNFFKNLRRDYLNQFNKYNRIIEKSKINHVDSFTKRVLLFIFNNYDSSYARKFISNNRLMTYCIFLLKNKLSSAFYQEIVKDTSIRLRKLLNSISFLSEVGRENGVEFILIKSLSVIPYLPVYDIDIYISKKNASLVGKLDKFLNLFSLSKEQEKNKINLLPKDETYFKLSFHIDITWDGVSLIKIDENFIHSNKMEIMPYVFINSPKVEALIRMGECLLERLYISFLDFLFMSQYCSNSLKSELFEFNDLKFPHFLKFKHLIMFSKASQKLLFKNSLRYVSWQLYTKITGNVPFRE